VAELREGGRGGATPLPGFALRRTKEDGRDVVSPLPCGHHAAAGGMRKGDLGGMVTQDRGEAGEAGAAEVSKMPRKCQARPGESASALFKCLRNQHGLALSQTNQP